MKVYSQKFAELVETARQSIYNNTALQDLPEMFVECFEAHERGVERGSCPSFGGQEWSSHNMEVLAGMAILALLHGDDGKDPLTLVEYMTLVVTFFKIIETPK